MPAPRPEPDPPEAPVVTRQRSLREKVLAALRLLVSLAILAAILWAIDWQATLRVLAGVHVGWAFAAAALSLADRAVLNLKWQVLLAALQVRVRWWPLLRLQMAANVLGTFFPSSIGVDAFRSYALIRDGHGKASVIAATLLDRLTIVGVTLLLGAVMLTLHSDLVLPRWISVLIYGGVAVAALGAACLALKRVRLWTGAMAERLMPDKWSRLLREAWHRGAEGVLQSRVLGSTVLSLAAAMVIRIWVGQCLALACGYHASFLEMLAAYPIVWIAVMLPITVGGLGLQEAAFIIAMQIIGMPAEVAVAMSILEHVVLRLALLPGALFIRELKLR